jgi:putative ABC transport system ATP-binding protein
MTTLTINDLTVEYSQGDYVVRPIHKLNLEVADGELVILLGPSGSGKTTLLSCLAGILSPTAGRIRMGDTEVTGLHGPALTRYRRDTVGIVFQAFNLIPSLNARENVMTPLRLAGVRARKARRRAEELLSRVGLGDRMRHRPHALSGGQQQRVAIARALVHEPSLVLADEPTAYLDYVQVEEILRIVRELAAPGRAVVIATHDQRLVPLADRTIELVPTSAPAKQAQRRRVLEPGQMLFEHGDPSDFVYIVDEGEIALVRERPDHSEEVIRCVGPGGYFGELGPLLRLPRSATARAIPTTVVTGYSPQDFKRFATFPDGRPPTPAPHQSTNPPPSEANGWVP